MQDSWPWAVLSSRLFSLLRPETDWYICVGKQGCLCQQDQPWTTFSSEAILLLSCCWQLNKRENRLHSFSQVSSGCRACRPPHYRVFFWSISGKHFRRHCPDIAAVWTGSCFSLSFIKFQIFFAVSCFPQLYIAQHMSLCSLQPLSPKCIVLFNQSVFNNASGFRVPRRPFS